MTAAEKRRRRIWTPDDDRAADAWFDTMLAETIHTDITHILPSEWATAHRILPEGLTSMPGPFRWEVTPYWHEILDNLGPQSPVREVYIRKGAQVGYTVAVLENFLGYVIDAEPGPMLYVTGDKGMAEAAMNLRVDRMIQSAGIQHKIFSQTTKKANKASGDTKDIKEFPGGFLKAIGPNSGAKLRSDSIRYLLGDELDAMPLEVGGASKDAVTAQEGDPWGLAVRRTDAFEAIRKILGGSTPLIKQTSRIAALYEEGDQRRYFVPCKHCGAMLPLEWANIKYDKDDQGRLVWDSVHYECPECHGIWTNDDKAFFLPRGEWRPTKEARRPNVRSYWLSSLYSPVGMRSWPDICEEWIKAQGNPGKLRVFVNTVLGEPYEERGDAPDYQRVMLRRESSESFDPERLTIGDDGAYTLTPATIPPGVLVLTLGADVQHDRIECELVGWSAGMESWSLGYHTIPGDTSDLDSIAWRTLKTIIETPRALPLSMALIDSGDGTHTPVVYSFCDGYGSGVAPLKGGYRSTGGRHVFAIRDVVGHYCKRIDLDEGYLKEEFYSLSRLGPADRPGPDDILPPGYCHFPSTLDRRHFEMLFAEDKLVETDRFGRLRVYWKKRGRNEPLDCRAYALGALYLVASAMTGTDDNPNAVDWPLFWEYLAKIKSA